MKLSGTSIPPDQLAEYNRYISLNSGHRHNSPPRSFTLSAFDGTSWVILDTETDEPDWTRGEVRSYGFTNATSFERYRLTISNAYGNYAMLGNLELLDASMVNQVPIMTGATAPSGAATASTMKSAEGWHPWQAFMQNVNASHHNWCGKLNALPAWIEYAFPAGAGFVCVAYTITSTAEKDGATKSGGRTRRGAMIPPSKKPKKEDADGLYACAKALHDYLAGLTPPAATVPTTAAILSEIGKGIFNPLYWEKCGIASTVYLTNYPTNEPDPAPPPYGYRTALFLPSLITYGLGTVDAAPMRYSGSKAGEYFCDLFWTWAKVTYTLLNNMRADDKEPAVIKWMTTITVDTSSRGSRPMLSLLMRVIIAPDGAPLLDDISPPLGDIDLTGYANRHQSQDMYWRYVLPEVSAPFWHATQDRLILRSARQAGSIDATSYTTRLTISCGNRPMLGKGYNNCDTVETAATGLPEVYQINKKRFAIVGYVEDGGGVAAILWTSSGYWSELTTLAGFTVSYAEAISNDGLTIAGVSNPSYASTGIQWDADGTAHSLGFPVDNDYSVAMCISGDGSTLGGYLGEGADYTAAYSDHLGNWVNFGHIDGDRQGHLRCMSFDGSVMFINTGYDNNFRAMRYTTGTGLIDLGRLEGETYTETSGCSDDGAACCGWINWRSGWKAWRWTAGTGMVNIGTISGADQIVAYGMSGDGNRIIGVVYLAGIPQGFMWDVSRGIILAGIPAGATDCYFYGISSDGSTAVGSATFPAGALPIAWAEDKGFMVLPIPPGSAYGTALGIQ
jgi:uncharacterized membrane protein